MGVTQIEDQLGPEKTAHRRIRTGLHRHRVEGGKQRENHDQISAPIADPATCGLQVTQIAEGAAARRAEGSKLRADPPAPLRAGTTPRLQRRSDDRARIELSGDVDREAVIAIGQRFRCAKPGVADFERGGFAVFELQLGPGLRFA